MTPTQWNCFASTANADGVATIQCLVPLIENLIRAVAALGGIAFFVMLIVGGFNFLFAGGDQKKLETARGTITQSIIGMVIMSLAYLILLTIETFTGVGVTEIQLPL